MAFMASCATHSLKVHEQESVPRAYLQTTPADVYVLTPINAQPHTAHGAQACLNRLCKLRDQYLAATGQEFMVVFMDAGESCGVGYMGVSCA